MLRMLGRLSFFELLLIFFLSFHPMKAFAILSQSDHQKLVHKKLLSLDLQKYLIQDEFSLTEGQPIPPLTAERMANFPMKKVQMQHTLPDPIPDLHKPTYPNQVDMAPDATDFRHAFGMPKMDYIILHITENDLAYQEGRASLGSHYAVRFNGNTLCVGGKDCDAPDFPWGSSNVLNTDPNSPPNECGNPPDPNNPLGVETCDRDSPSGGYYCWDIDHHHCHARNFYTARVIKLDDPRCLENEGEDEEDSPSLDCNYRDPCTSLEHRSMPVGAGNKIGFLFTDSTPIRDDTQVVRYSSANSGIQAGWADVYWGFLPGQWVLLDDPQNPGHPIESGKYIFQHAVNIKGEPPLDPCAPNATFPALLPGEASMRNNMLEMAIQIPEESGFHEDLEGTLWDWLLSLL